MRTAFLETVRVILVGVLVSCTLALVAGGAACTSEGAPGASSGVEWQRARAAYDVAMAQNGVGYLGPRWDEALALLRAVPPHAGADHRRARALVDEIERTRAAAAAQLQKGAADAEKLLDIPVSEPLAIGPPDAGPSTTTLPPPPQGALCRNDCVSSMLGCLDAAGCRRSGGKVTCEGGLELQAAATECRTKQLACDQQCPASPGR